MQHPSQSPVAKRLPKKPIATPSDEESSEAPPRASMKKPAASGSSSGGGKKKPTALRRAGTIARRPAASGDAMVGTRSGVHGPDQKPESWFDGSKSSEAVAEDEIGSLSSGLLLEAQRPG